MDDRKEDTTMHINWFKDENHLVYINGATQLAELERIAPGYAKEWLSVELARDRQRRLFRLLGLGVTMVLAVFAIGFGQWALVNGATSEALFLSGTGLVGLVGAFLSKN